MQLDLCQGKSYTRSVDFEFDPVKDAANLAKHGLGLAFGFRAFADRHRLVIKTEREQDGERRRKAVGLVDGKLFTAVHVGRDGAIRFISVRRSNDGEERLYDRA